MNAEQRMELAVDLASACRSAGMIAEVMPPRHPARAVLVNAWSIPSGRYPNATVAVDDDGYTWGPHWEHRRCLDINVSRVAQAISETSVEGR